MNRSGTITVPLCVFVLAACTVFPHPSPGTPTGATSVGGTSAESDAVVRMLEDIRALSTIGAHRGWRTAGSPGEAMAFEFVAGKLEALAANSSLQLEVTRETYRLPVGSQIHEARLWLDAGTGEMEAPADAICCSRRADAAALYFDSDGQAGDLEAYPVEVSGVPLRVRTADDLARLRASRGGRIAVVDFALVDTYVQGTEVASRNARSLLEARPAGILLVTRFSNKVGESHGTQLAVGSIFTRMADEPWPPILYARLEDLGPAGVTTWDDLDTLHAIRLQWDADILMPGESANLVARIPGVDGDHAIIVGAMLDSVNIPGAMDNAAGASVLLEVARRLAIEGQQPPVDLYLVWFGAEEVGLVGSSYFAATHQALLDETLAVLTIDCLGSPLDGLTPRLTFGSWPYGVAGQVQMPWVEDLVAFALGAGFSAGPSMSGGGSDNMSFVVYDVPNANLIYMNEDEMNEAGGIHYAIHIHDPYDEAALAEKESATLARMFDVAYAASTGEIGEASSLRVSPRPEARALLVGSHTEAVDLPMTTLTSFGIVLAMEGVDVDLLPYGAPVTLEALGTVDMAILLPVMDYPVTGLGPEPYDESWTPAEADAIEQFVEQGGQLVLAASRHQLGWTNALWDANEDWADMNTVAERFGISFAAGDQTDPVTVVSGGSLNLGVNSLESAEGNGVPIVYSAGEALARAGQSPAVVYVAVGDAGGGVIAVSDLGMLGSYGYDPRNVPFWRMLAQLALER